VNVDDRGALPLPSSSSESPITPGESRSSLPVVRRPRGDAAVEGAALAKAISVVPPLNLLMSLRIRQLLRGGHLSLAATAALRPSQRFRPFYVASAALMSCLAVGLPVILRLTTAR